MAKNLSSRIRSMITRQVKNRGIVVWYDPEKAYTGLIKDLGLSDTTVLQYTDSFFRLRHELEPHLEFVTAEAKPKGGCGVAPNLVVYIPMERGQDILCLDRSRNCRCGGRIRNGIPGKEQLAMGPGEIVLFGGCPR